MLIKMEVARKVAGKLSTVVGNLIKIGAVLHCTVEYVADFVICSGPSMEPGIRDDDILVTEHISVLMNRLCRGDIVITRSPMNPMQYICKRIRAIPGDKLIQTDGTFLYVPNGHIWIEGDNPGNSTDSRNYGPIPIGLVRGRVIYKIWPFNSIKSF